MTEKQPNSEWTGIKGFIGARVLNSPLRRVFEILFWGDSRSAFLNEVSPRINGGSEIVLDIGAGSGYFSLAVAKKLRTGKVICLDLSEEMLQHLKQTAERKGLQERIQLLYTAASSTGLEDQSVDLVVSNFVLHELSNPETVLREMLRVLKPGGWAIITDFRRDTWIGKRIAAGHSEDAYGPFSIHELETLFAQVGLHNVKVSPVKHLVIGVGEKKTQECAG
jgi:ubiquinone/menaquinone biosynthesis C-methylase UbiE